MQRRITGASRAALVVLAALSIAAGKTDEKTHRLRVLATTDEHSHLFAIAPEVDDFPLPSTAGIGALKGGVARRATVLAAARADRNVDTVTLSNGDFSQGTLASTAFAVASFDLVIMKLLGYDAVALGNHEFDLGPYGLALSLQAAAANGGRPPIVAANLFFSEGGADAALAALTGGIGSGKPITSGTVVTTSSGLKVGVVGAIGPSAAFDATPTAAPVTFTGGADPRDVPAAVAAIAGVVQPVIDALRKDQGVDAIILLAHAGASGSATHPTEGDLLVGALRGVDLMVAGHSHAQPDRLLVATDADGRAVPIVQPGPFGNEIAQIELVIRPGKRPALADDGDVPLYLPVDDRVVPTEDPVIRGTLDGVIAAIENGFVAPTLSLIEGAPVVFDPAHVGGLYYRSLGHTTFDVLGDSVDGETNVLNLDTDALRAVANALGQPAPVALQAAGAVFGDIVRGRTGTLAFADLYRVLPLGVDPADGSPGYPVVRLHLRAADLFGALEQTLQFARVNNDFYLSPSGLAVTYDATRPPFSPASPGSGWITHLALVDAASETVLFDADGGWRVNPFTTLVPIVTTYQVAAFASSFGIVPRDANGDPVSLSSAVLRWPVAGAPAVKDHQAFARYVRTRCLQNGGELPSEYDAAMPQGAVPRRVLCTGTACP
ncbi:bifunctional metallophosphatase/5'-nucleotidase [Anaeromyxobacter oryzae]|uniref:5'-Nucleotidase C-terminal domain-containing protein n=1 Tax=Anaeromyxobacter oryzae TaxID=2918170 RepID=A0ABN6MSB8_9BACT|nr:5'-nucleotidase C-terminal domain-containing protein [Anaeromyxobacter oryzae]BDG03175.1 hypothetical protein AMOR_21710 [Anaeromyxobacter oryzae]